MSEPFMQETGQGHAQQTTDGAWSHPWLLTQCREAAGLHIAALAAALKVPVKKLEALEAGRYDELPDMTFARGLASSACRHLRVDPAPVLEQIPLAVTPQLGDSGLAINAPFKPMSVSSPANPVGWLSRPAVLGAIALMLGALVLVFLPDISISPPAAVEQSTSTTVMPPADPVDDPDSPAMAPSDSAVPGDPAPATIVEPAALPAAAGTSTAVSESPGGALPDAAPAATSASGSAPATSLLRIRATGDSWVEVVNGTGGVVIQRMLRAGDVVDFSSTPPYAVVLGRVDAAEVTVRGQLFDATPFARNSVARFEVK
ncbi:MAG: helix-turn-helix domain-containing protein [Hydrogenophaga sp.]|nr:helix-turn-helix domain-containing protein [Hydrogenophaga sp.]